MTTQQQRRLLIAGNWKMHKTRAEAAALAQGLCEHCSTTHDRDIVIIPPYTALADVARVLEHSSNIALGAQELFYEDAGAYTGAISAPQLRDTGCRYVLVGHSERRQLFGETLVTSYKRTAAALAHGLIPILCVGETEAEKNNQQTHAVITAQLQAVIAHLSEPAMQQLVIAYEPVWAIGTSLVATPPQAQEVHALIRGIIAKQYPNTAKQLRIIYGGSVKPDNAQQLLTQPDIDGLLVGGASLSVQSFVAIVQASRL